MQSPNLALNVAWNVKEHDHDPSSAVNLLNFFFQEISASMTQPVLSKTTGDELHKKLMAYTKTSTQRLQDHNRDDCKKRGVHKGTILVYELHTSPVVNVVNRKKRLSS